MLKGEEREDTKIRTTYWGGGGGGGGIRNVVSGVKNSFKEEGKDTKNWE